MEERIQRFHQLKSWPEYFQAVRSGEKRFEVRVNDRGILSGDVVLLVEWDPELKRYSGHSILADVGWMIQGEAGLPDSVCVFGLDNVRYLLGPNSSVWAK